MKSQLLIYHSEENFLRALAILQERKTTEFETLSAFDLKHSSAFAGPNSSFQIVKAATLVGALAGLTTGFALAWYPSVVDTPLNVGGRPLNSWPAFVPLIFVLGVLFAALCGFVAFCLRLRFPEPYHPVFEFQDFQLQENQFYIFLPKILENPLLEVLKPEKIKEATR